MATSCPCYRRRATALTSPPTLAAATVPTQTMPPLGTFFFLHFILYSFVFLFLVSPFISYCSFFSFVRVFFTSISISVASNFSLMIFFLCLFFPRLSLLSVSFSSPFFSSSPLPKLLRLSVTNLHPTKSFHFMLLLLHTFVFTSLPYLHSF
jgi:hypothetical protein